jgi:hypothetical protein
VLLAAAFVAFRFIPGRHDARAAGHAVAPELVPAELG